MGTCFEGVTSCDSSSSEIWPEPFRLMCFVTFFACRLAVYSAQVALSQTAFGLALELVVSLFKQHYD